jgi:hypothetical protein
MSNKKIRILEFLLIGVIMGLGEDLLAIVVATDTKIDFSIIWVVLLVAIPFAFISEVVVDHPKFWEKIFGKPKDES